MTILQDAYEEFMQSRYLAGLTEKTLSSYKYCLTPFVDFCGANTDVLEVTDRMVQAYIGQLLGRGLSQGTLSTTVQHVKVFLQYLADDYPVVYRLRKVRVPKMPKKSLRIYNEAEIVQIFQNVPGDCPWLVYRNSAVIALMLDSGLRQSEVCDLLWADLDFSTGVLKVCGKGNKERLAPMGRFTRHYLELYQSACPCLDERRVFVGRRGQALTGNAVKLMIQKIKRRLPFEISSHKLRHNFATNYCLDQYEKYGQVDIYRLMILMGHASVETTRVYLHFANQQIAARTSISHIDGIMLPENNHATISKSDEPLPSTGMI